MNETEIDRIACAVGVLRPDWPVASLRTLLRRPELANRPRRDVAVALAWVAAESETKTPARVLEPGPWWKATQADGTTTGHHHPARSYGLGEGDPREVCVICALHRADCERRHPNNGHEFTPRTTDDWMRRRPRPKTDTPSEETDMSSEQLPTSGGTP